MALRKETVVDNIEILEDGHLQVRRATYVVEDDGVRALLGYHRVAYSPGVDVDHEDPRVKAISQVDWTPERIAAYRTRMEG